MKAIGTATELDRPEIKNISRNRKTVWLNFDAMVKQINRDSQHILKFFSSQLNTTGHQTGSNKKELLEEESDDQEDIIKVSDED